MVEVVHKRRGGNTTKKPLLDLTKKPAADLAQKAFAPKPAKVPPPKPLAEAKPNLQITTAPDGPPIAAELPEKQRTPRAMVRPKGPDRTTGTNPRQDHPEGRRWPCKNTGLEIGRGGLQG